MLPPRSLSFHLAALCALVVTACHSDARPAPIAATAGESLLIQNARLPGGPSIEVFVVDGLIVKVGTNLELDAGTVIDAKGRYLVPGIIDSHVHLDYLPVGDRLAAQGIAGAVDLAAPLPLRKNPSGLDLVSTGPMLVAPSGYPTRSWGRDGYGVEVESHKTIEHAIDTLRSQGASLVKISLGAGPDLSEELLCYLVDYAHGLDMKVAAHALSDEAAAMAAQIGADILAHTPIEELQARTIVLWSRKTVISTLSAFGNTLSAARNLRALQLAGATVLYGTDLGNSRDVGISCSEIQAMHGAGMRDREILHAMTMAPAIYFGMSSLGTIAVGQKARFLLVVEDPESQIETLCEQPLVVSDTATQLVNQTVNSSPF